MKKAIAVLSALVLLQAFSSLAWAAQPLDDFFSDVVAIEGVASSGQWQQAQNMTEAIRQRALAIAPAVRSAMGEHSYKALLGFVMQLQLAVQTQNSGAVAGPITSLQKMHDWLSQLSSGS